MTIDRRKFMELAGTAAWSALLAACDSRGPKGAERILRYAERKNESLERAAFPSHVDGCTDCGLASDRQSAAELLRLENGSDLERVRARAVDARGVGSREPSSQADARRSPEASAARRSG